MLAITWIAHFLCAVGAMNWGLTIFFEVNLVEHVSNMLKLEYLKESLYLLVSISGLYVLIGLFV